MKKEKKKKLLSWGDILASLRSGRLQDSKNAGHQPSTKHLFIRKLKKKKTILHGLSLPNPNFSEFAFLGN
jgi:hypothetical protein